MGKNYNASEKQFFNRINDGSRYLLIIVLFFAGCFTAHAQTWTAVGAPGFSASTAWYTSIAIDQGGTPYVVYQDYANSQKATVKKFNGSSWVTVGSPGFTGWIAYFTSIAIDTGGTPYVAFEDFANSYKVSVMKFDGTNWVYVGAAGFSAGTTSFTSIAIDRNGTPYVAFEDFANGKKATVMKFNGASWVNVGTPAFSDTTASYTNIAIDTAGTPYVVYADGGYSQKTTVMKFDGATWVALGGPGMSAGGTSYPAIAIRADTPYVLYVDNANGQKATAMKYTGSSWGAVGSPGFSAGVTSYTSLAITGGGTPYAAYFDAANNSHATVMKYNGSGWVTVGLPGFSDSIATYTSIAVNSSGTPYVVYSDYADTQRATVMTLDTALAPITGSKTLCVGATTTLGDLTTGGVWSSHNTAIATVGSSGIVTGVSSGTDKISYTVSGNSAIVTVTVYPIPAAGSITGPSVMCADSSINLTDAAGGGVWSSGTTAIATVNTFGTVTGHSGGTVTISYSVINICGSNIATHIVTVNPLLNPGTISGANSLCGSATITLSDLVTGGTWSSSNTAVVTVNTSGSVTGHAVGTATISYGATNGCGVSFATKIISVAISPVAGTITGTTTLCGGTTTNLTDAASGGIWSSNNTVVATVNTTGIVGGHAGGTATISYTVTNSCGTAFATTIVTVSPLPDPGSIAGANTVCASSTITLSDAVPGGVWSSSNPGIAAVSISGLVSGIALGTTTISYTVTNSCGPNAATKVVTVVHLPDAGSITGTSSLCADSSATLTDAAVGGAWSSSNTAIATVNSSGVVSGHSGGTATISYLVTNSCGADFATHTVTLNPLPTAGSITGKDSVCTAATVTLSDAVAGGMWSSSNTAIATIGSTGIVSGHITGTVGISYAVANSCGVSFATQTVTVDSLLNPGSIAGPSVMCADSAIALTEGVVNGMWSSANTAIATVGGTTGIVNGHSAGTVIISYAVTNSCGTTAATQAITVHPLPDHGSITGTDSVCKSSAAMLGETVSGGVWSSGDSGIVAIDSTGAISGSTAGTTTISYTVTNSCGVSVATQTITIGELPDAGSITGIDTVCTSGTITVSDTLSGGVWSSSTTAIATVDSTGSISGIIAGTVSISYALTNSCGTSVARKIITVNACVNGAKDLGKLILFPDPNNGHFTAIIYTLIKENATVIVTNSLGKKIQEFLATTNTETDVQLNVPPGIYCITAFKGSGTVSTTVEVW